MANPRAVTVAETTPATALAPGFRFHPTDEELVQYYLKRKASGKPFRFQAVSEIDVYKSEPDDLAERYYLKRKACGKPFRFRAVSKTDVYKSKPDYLADYSMMKTRDQEWYFFSPVDRKYGNGSRLNRATEKGYWKATGKDRNVRHKGQTIGMKKTLVFHSGRAPDGKRTNWVMHEYRLADEGLEKARVAQDAFVLCRIFQKSGLGPPTGDRYAPFVEEEWNDETQLIIPGAEAGEDMTNGDETQLDGNEYGRETNLSEEPLRNDNQNLPFVCKRERSDEFPLEDNKRSKNDDPNSSNGNISDDSTTTAYDPYVSNNTTNTPNLTTLEFPLLESLEPKENNGSSSGVTFEAANLEKSVPPGYLKFISNLENGILNVSMERETLKIEVMRAQAMINILQSHIDLLIKENEELKRAC